MLQSNIVINARAASSEPGLGFGSNVGDYQIIIRTTERNRSANWQRLENGIKMAGL